MPQIRLALVQANPTVGDLTGNSDQVVEWTRAAADAGAHVVALPEMFLTGYPIEDLALRTSFVDASRATLRKLALQLRRRGLGDVVVVVGYLDRLDEDPLAGAPGRPHGSPQNAAAVIHNGGVIATYSKHHLPNYGVFDEFRYFVPGTDTTHVRVHGVDIALAICEDLWQDGGPVADIANEGASLLLVLNGSPYELNKDDVRHELVARRAREAGCALAYVNMTGAQDELVFDGDSIVVSAEGAVLARAPQFSDHLLVVDLDLPAADADREMPTVGEGPLPTFEPRSSHIETRISDEEEIYTAIVTGVRDYVHKNGFSSVLIGLSGGIDSALTAAIACDAIGPESVYGVSMPSQYSSDHSIADAEDLATRTGVRYRCIPIESIVKTFLEELGLTGVAEENLQARVRGTTLMGLSNQEGHLVLATGNKSELAVGYTTLYGDAVGGFAPLKDLPKTLVWRLARWRNGVAGLFDAPAPIPESSVTKPPSAELRPGQLDTDSLPDYEVLDEILTEYVENDRGAEELVSAGYDSTLVERILRMIDAAEYKRRQYPPGPKLSLRAFGRDRRLPITNAWQERQHS